MSRIYSVSLQSEALPVGFRIATIPGQSGTEAERLRDLGLSIVTFGQQREPDRVAASTLLTNLVALELQYGGPASRRALMEPMVFESDNHEFLAFINFVASQSVVPIESSPMHGSSIANIGKDATLTAFATFTENDALRHHDPFLILMTPVMTIVIGAVIGAGKGLQARVEHLLSPPKSQRRKRKKK